MQDDPRPSRAKVGLPRLLTLMAAIFLPLAARFAASLRHAALMRLAEQAAWYGTLRRFNGGGTIESSGLCLACASNRI